MKRKPFNPTNSVLALIAVTLSAVAWQQGGMAILSAALRKGGGLILRVFPLLVAAFLTAGLIQVLIDRETVERFLGSGSGWRGLLLACLGGALIPGGPYVYYPIAGALLARGAGLGVLVAFVTAKNLWSLSRLPVEFALLGPQLTVVRFLATLLAPPGLGYLADRLFGHSVDRIRAAVASGETDMGS